MAEIEVEASLAVVRAGIAVGEAAKATAEVTVAAVKSVEVADMDWEKVAAGVLEASR